MLMQEMEAYMLAFPSWNCFYEEHELQGLRVHFRYLKKDQYEVVYKIEN